MKRSPRLVFAALACALVPLLAASCEETTSQQKPQTPPQPSAAYPNGPNGMNPWGQPMGQAPPVVGMSPTPSAPPTLTTAPPMPPPAPLPPAAAGPYQQGMAAFAAGDLNAAKGLFQQVIQTDARAHHAHYSLGAVQERLREPEAASSYQKALSITPDYEPAIIAYAMLQARKGNLGEAERLLTEKRATMPRSAAVTATLAEVKSLQKDTGSAQRLAQEALKINPDYRPAMVVIARDHYRNRRLDLALYALQAILDGFGTDNPPRDKENPEALLLRGLILREQSQRAGAMDNFRRAVQRRPDLVEARVQLAAMLLEAGNGQEALPLLEGAVRYDGDNLPAHLALGDTYRLLGRYGDAKREFEWVLARDASMPQVHYDLGLLYLFAPSVPGMSAKQQVAEAIVELKKYQELRRKGERDDSEELLQRAKLKEGELSAAAAAAAEAPAPVASLPSPASNADAGASDAAPPLPNTAPTGTPPANSAAPPPPANSAAPPPAPAPPDGSSAAPAPTPAPPPAPAPTPTSTIVAPFSTPPPGF
ncbi:tetratricopeptide repeat protein [Polyangium jinanense]|uniref:Tetratricopeptide repeat protein n=1 Tax=Polyangium jinanense TaxID=2829994 RepID=A0A9X3XA09_9BACT|nr:tetratricopeptide repeat protein [Polyangium jinanense]MDC3959469.1 tetratricopeptide repeat protein [Polyangium jinanense]MDC3984903.1 tetratricopeptide repeat protein [Polyangium jinanense]